MIDPIRVQANAGVYVVMHVPCGIVPTRLDKSFLIGCLVDCIEAQGGIFIDIAEASSPIAQFVAIRRKDRGILIQREGVRQHKEADVIA